MLIDDIAEICGIHDKGTQRRIICWKARRRYMISVKYGAVKQAVPALWLLLKNGGFTGKLLKESFWRIWNKVLHPGVQE